MGDILTGDLEVLEVFLEGPEEGTHGGHHIGLRGLVKEVGGRGTRLRTRGDWEEKGVC